MAQSIRPGLIAYVGGATCVAAGVAKVMFGTHWLLGAALAVAGGVLIAVTFVLNERRSLLRRPRTA